MQSGQFKQTLDVFFIIYKVHAFPKSKKKASLLTFKEQLNVFCVHEKQYKEPTFLIHTAFSGREVSLQRDQLSDCWFSISGHKTHRDGVASNVHAGDNTSHCGKIPFLLRNCRYPIPQLRERTFQESRGCRHLSITEGNQNSRQQQEILMATSYHLQCIREESPPSPLKPDQQVLRCLCRGLL